MKALSEQDLNVIVTLGMLVAGCGVGAFLASLNTIFAFRNLNIGSITLLFLAILLMCLGVPIAILAYSHKTKKS